MSFRKQVYKYYLTTTTKKNVNTYFAGSLEAVFVVEVETVV